MVAKSEITWDKVLHLPANQIPIFMAFLDTLDMQDTTAKKDVSKRIGVASGITFPADFDEIDYGTLDLFVINS